MQALFEYNQQADAQFKETFNNLGDENIEKVRCGDEKGITVWSQHRALERLFKQIAAIHTHTGTDVGAFCMWYMHKRDFKNAGKVFVILKHSIFT